MTLDTGERGFWATAPASQNGHAMLSCGGELDMATAGILRDATQHLAGNVTIDFSDVTFCDSSGIAALVGLYHRLDATGHRVRVVNVHPAIARVFELCGLVEPLGVQTTGEHVSAD